MVFKNLSLINIISIVYVLKNVKAFEPEKTEEEIKHSQLTSQWGPWCLVSRASLRSVRGTNRGLLN